MPNLEAFAEKIEGEIQPTHSAREIAEKFVIAVLEAEYGRTFTSSPGFAKMVDTLAEIVVTNPELRRQALSLASVYIKKSRDRQNRTQRT